MSKVSLVEEAVGAAHGHEKGANSKELFYHEYGSDDPSHYILRRVDNKKKYKKATRRAAIKRGIVGALVGSTLGAGLGALHGRAEGKRAMKQYAFENAIGHGIYGAGLGALGGHYRAKTEFMAARGAVPTPSGWYLTPKAHKRYLAERKKEQKERAGFAEAVRGRGR